MTNTEAAESRERFEQEALQHLDSLYRTALRMTRNPSDAEDLVQDALVRAYRFYDRYESGTNFRAWLFKILTNTFINKYRRSVKERNLSDDHERESVAANFFSHDATAFGGSRTACFHPATSNSTPRANSGRIVSAPSAVKPSVRSTSSTRTPPWNWRSHA